MTLLGKIFTVLIFIMSLVFMSFTVMVYATHTNWKKRALLTAEDLTKEENAGFKEVGLKHQLADLVQANLDLDAELQVVLSDLELERASRAKAIQHLESKNTSLTNERDLKEKELAGLITDQATLRQQLSDALTEQKNLSTQVAQLRVDIIDAEKDRDKQFREVIALTDKLHQNEGARRRLEERRNQLAYEVTDMKSVMDKFGITVHTPTHNIPPKPLDGYVTEVSPTNGAIIEISLGSDDGIRVNHQLVVYRAKSYLCKVVIRKVDTNFAVAEVIKETRRGTIRKGDNVTTRLS